MKKKIILLLIILIPSIIYFFFELSEVNFKKMAFYGPKTVKGKGDTIYYSVPESALELGRTIERKMNDSLGNEFTVAFLNEDKNIKDSSAKLFIFFDKEQESKLAGLLEFEKYKKQKLDFLKVILVKPYDVSVADTNYYDTYLKDSLGIQMNNFYLRTVASSKEDFNKARSSYFVGKPVHVFNYFAVLVDNDRHVRGYYDPTYVSEVKRMIEEYKHLVLKDEHSNMQNENKIEQK